MRVARVRASTAYILIGLALLLVIAGVVTLLYVVQLRGQVEQSKTQSRAACERGNVLRENTRSNTTSIARMATIIAELSTNEEIKAEFQQLVPELDARLSEPKIQDQPCDVLFPR